MRSTLAALFCSFFPFINAQKAGTLRPENQPPLTVKICNKEGCQPVLGSVTVDANWRHAHDGKGKNCYTGNLWSPELCPNGETCIKNC
ncbi:hypothetical protein O181_084568, partial [Austropuccinia psidii MF-1]|nr:hypothetical protein [Austropuccinia psidii MF-1]